MPRTFTEANRREICEQTGKHNIRFGFCNSSTLIMNVFSLAYSMKVMGKLAQFIGVQLPLKSLFDNIDDQLFATVVADGVNLSLSRGTTNSCL